MTINRRQFIESFAASAACVGIGKSEAATLIGTERGTWYLGRQQPTSDVDLRVDFWSKPYGPIDYEDYQLPSGIRRGVLWYDAELFDRHEPPPNLRHVDLLFIGTRINWMNDPRLFVAHSGSRGDFQSTITRFVADNVRAHTTAILALDSHSLSGADPHWLELLPAFRCCYDRIFGVFHESNAVQWMGENLLCIQYFVSNSTERVEDCEGELTGRGALLTRSIKL
jgi:hypothetical protein